MFMKKLIILFLFIAGLSLIPSSSTVAAASFIYPVGGESFVAGQTYTVSWTPIASNGSLMYVRVSVIFSDTYDFACTTCEIIGQTDWSLSDPGQVSITIPASLSTGNYRLAAQFVGGTGESFFSNPFQITGLVSPTITSPEANDNWAKGSTQTVSWDGDYSFFPQAIDKVSVRLEAVDGSPVEWLARRVLPPTTKQLEVSIPATVTPEDYKIKVMFHSSLPSPYERSSPEFTIVPAGGGNLDLGGGSGPGWWPPKGPPDVYIDSSGNAVCKDPETPGCFPPINVSLAPQLKAGSLGIGGNFLVGGWSPYILPASLNLGVFGNIGAKKYCNEKGENCHPIGDLVGGGDGPGGTPDNYTCPDGQSVGTIVNGVVTRCQLDNTTVTNDPTGVSSVSAGNSGITVSPNTGAVVVSLNTAGLPSTCDITSATGKVYWDGTKLACGNDRGGTNSGEANTASNIGTNGVGVYDSKSVVDLRFSKLVAGSNVGISKNDSTKEITISASAAGVGKGTDGQVLTSWGEPVTVQWRTPQTPTFSEVIAGSSVVKTYTKKNSTASALADQAIGSYKLCFLKSSVELSNSGIAYEHGCDLNAYTSSSKNTVADDTFLESNSQAYWTINVSPMSFCAAICLK